MTLNMGDQQKLISKMFILQYLYMIPGLRF